MKTSCKHFNCWCACYFWTTWHLGLWLFKTSLHHEVWTTFNDDDVKVWDFLFSTLSIICCAGETVEEQRRKMQTINIAQPSTNVVVKPSKVRNVTSVVCLPLLGDWPLGPSALSLPCLLECWQVLCCSPSWLQIRAETEASSTILHFTLSAW